MKKSIAKINYQKKKLQFNSQSFGLWILALLIFVQSLMTMQTHTKVVTNSKGIAIIVCTLDGYQTSYIGSEPEEQQQSKRSPTCLFSSLLADAHLLTNTLDSHYVVFSSQTTNSSILSSVSQTSLRYSHIRAPPIT